MNDNENLSINGTPKDQMDELNELAVKTVAAAIKGANEDNAVTAEGDDIGGKFAGLPIESLICKPILAAAQGQQELTAIYVDTIKKLAYKDGESNEANILSFDMQRPVVDNSGKVEQQTYKISAPLLSLVPLPAFTMDELTVDFEMEVKDSTLENNKTHADASTTIKYKSWWGLDAQITGNISSDSEHKRTTDNSATYKIHARALQQPPSEGMAKLTALLAQGMEPIKSSAS